MRERIASMRATLVARRTSLDDAYRFFDDSPPRTPTPTPPGGPPRRRPPTPPRKEEQAAKLLATLTSAHVALQDELARARQGLVHELVDVFAVVEVGGRPASGVRAGTRGDWAIGGLVLPVPGDMRRFPPAHVNAALTFTVHFFGLLSFYLGVKLPFEISWSGGKLGVGAPEICAGRGGESGAWARWTARCPLHLPLHANAVNNGSPPRSPSGSPRPSSLPSPGSPSLSSSARRDSLSSSTISASLAQSSASFPTALAMLSYNIAYLAFTQNVDVPLSLAASGTILPTLWGVCCSAELGRRSHATGFAVDGNGRLGSLPAPTHGFALDFRQLLQAQATAADQNLTPARMRMPRGREELTIEEEEGWEVVEDA